MSAKDRRRALPVRLAARDMAWLTARCRGAGGSRSAALRRALLDALRRGVEPQSPRLPLARRTLALQLEPALRTALATRADALGLPQGEAVSHLIAALAAAETA